MILGIAPLAERRAAGSSERQLIEVLLSDYVTTGRAMRQHGRFLVYRPSLLPPVLQGDHFDYRWTGSPAPTVARLTNLGTN